MKTKRSPSSTSSMAVRGGADETQQQDIEENSDLPQESAVLLTTEESPVENSTENSTEEILLVDKGGPQDESSMTLAREQAQELRQAGKDLHDQGDWEQAAVTFQKASLLLQDWEPLLEEYATCRLHEALCRLKEKDYEQCVEACTAVLERQPPAAIRARALHRRSRAMLGLGLKEDALQDARSAAFLGDRKAVALYGKLMRQDSPNEFFQDLFQGNGGINSFLPTAAATGDSSLSSSALLESLLNKSTSNNSASPMSRLMNGNNNMGGGLAKSVLLSLSKQVENESTQENICRYLRNANEAQVQQWAAMAGVPLSKGHASRLVSFCHGVTPKGIRRSVKTTKRVWYGISLVRKISQVASKYRNLLVLWVLLAWIKSALQRPIPVNKKAARLAMKQALAQGVV